MPVCSVSVGGSGWFGPKRMPTYSFLTCHGRRPSFSLVRELRRVGRRLDGERRERAGQLMVAVTVSGGAAEA